MYYGNESSSLWKAAADRIKAKGMIPYLAIDALRICHPTDPTHVWVDNGYTTLQCPESWCQKDPSSTVPEHLAHNGYLSYHPTGAGLEAWYCPTGPFVTRVTLPRVLKAIDCGFAGVFLMSFCLWKDETGVKAGADENPDYSMNIRNDVYGCKVNWPDYRKAIVKDMAARICQVAKSAGLQVIYSDDNIYVRPWADVLTMAERYATRLGPLQPYSDRFMFEWCSAPEDEDPVHPELVQDVLSQYVVNARNNDSPQITDRILYLTYQKTPSLFTYQRQKAAQLDYDMWVSWRYLANKTVPPYA